MKLNIKTTAITAGFALAMGSGVFIGQAIAYQPNMHAALDSLRSARSDLEAATRNKGGHRVRAIALIDQAIDEVKMGMEDAD